VISVPQPTPAEWWAGLDEAVRVAYMAASKRGATGFDRWDALHVAGSHAPADHLMGHPWEYQLPSPYLEYARARATEREHGDLHGSL
jgi:hypothetical protein